MHAEYINPDSCFDRRYRVKLSEDEEKRVIEILNELTHIFGGSGFAMELPELTLSENRDYHFTVYGGINTSHEFGFHY